MSLPAPLAGNLTVLEQGRTLLTELSDDLYAGAGLERGSVGAQYRHVLDHYGSLLGGLASGLVDYDAREREPLLEASRAAADERTGFLCDALGRLSGADLSRPLRVHLAASANEAEAEPWPSSLGRELLFVVSHTVHHFAIIRLLLAERGHSCAAEFGVAPSTLAFRAR